MTEAQVRQKLVNVIKGWIGCKESDGSHKKIIDIYNEHKPLARGYKVKYTDFWCATTVSAAAIVAELTDIIPTECSCSVMIELFKKLGAWKENDAYVPAPGDIVFYDWQDSGAGDNKGNPDHVGIVEKIVGSTITVIEGNNNRAVARRNIVVNGKYIRGYGIPKYSSKADTKKKEPAEKNDSPKVGDVVKFTGNKQYTSSYAGGIKKSAKPCKARITAVNNGKKHAYHLIAVSGSGVYGWVDESDIEGTEKPKKSIKVGDTVNFSGKVHYSSSYANSKGNACKPGKAKVTKINKNGNYPYHCTPVKGGGSNVYGWVKESDVSK